MQIEHGEVLVRNLLEVFNERDEAARLTVIRELYTEDAIFFEMEESFQGFERINQQVTAVLKMLPPGALFRTAGPQTANHNLVRLPWTLATEDGSVIASGMDVALLTGDRIAALYLFLNPPGDKE